MREQSNTSGGRATARNVLVDAGFLVALLSRRDAKLRSAYDLRQAILRHAFTGRLVPQDPNDEPASKLLERIAAEREAHAREAAAAKGKPKRVIQRKKS